MNHGVGPCGNDPLSAEAYAGFEQGPIRPPSESGSLLLRLTRNCPWNRCTFCGLYKGAEFSRRSVAHILQDIELIRSAIAYLATGTAPHSGEEAALDPMALAAARNWLYAGGRSVFLQDSNSLILKPDDLVHILSHLRSVFPRIQRITSYARSRTIARIQEQDLARIAAAGLNRIHIGLESGCDQVLTRVRKGADQQAHVRAGLKVKAAGIELSEYFMPGLGGRALSPQHARESAEALNRINPDFIRLRTLAVPRTIELAGEVAAGTFDQMSELEVAAELRLFLQSLAGITSQVKSDHILNLLEEIDGVLPQDQARMLAAVDRFLALAPEEQVLFQIGRRTGVLHRLDELEDPGLRRRAQCFVEQFGARPENVDCLCAALMEQFI